MPVRLGVQSQRNVQGTHPVRTPKWGPVRPSVRLCYTLTAVLVLPNTCGTVCKQAWLEKSSKGGKEAVFMP